MKKDRIWTLLSRKLSGEATNAELHELEDLLQLHPESDIALQLVKEYWGIPAEADADYLDATYHLHKQRIKQAGYDIEMTDINNQEDSGELNIEQEGLYVTNGKKIFIWSAAALAAVVVFIMFFTGTETAATIKTAKTPSEVSTKNGSRSKITLPDGTQVWLNGNSRLFYDNENFGKTIREVSLTGEAYFDVVKNATKPFVIHTAEINIKVLGTAFNVKAYPEDKQTETSLIRGSVEVTIKNRPNNKIILSPDEKLVVDNSSAYILQPAAAQKTEKEEVPQPQVSVNKLVYSPIDSIVAETAWVNNRLVFRDESFEEMAVKMQRWYNIEIEITDPKLAKQRITVTFVNETITQALDALKISFPFKYRQDGTKIIIYH
jgi:ferric-dicitrate binding protein FerR (iron transport regulator)